MQHYTSCQWSHEYVISRSGFLGMDHLTFQRGFGALTKTYILQAYLDQNKIPAIDPKKKVAHIELRKAWYTEKTNIIRTQVSRKTKFPVHTRVWKIQSNAKSPISPQMGCPLDINHYIFVQFTDWFSNLWCTMMSTLVNLVKSKFQMYDFKIFNCKSSNKLFFRCVN